MPEKTDPPPLSANPAVLGQADQGHWFVPLALFVLCALGIAVPLGLVYAVVRAQPRPKELHRIKQDHLARELGELFPAATASSIDFIDGSFCEKIDQDGNRHVFVMTYVRHNDSAAFSRWQWHLRELNLRRAQELTRQSPDVLCEMQSTWSNTPLSPAPELQPNWWTPRSTDAESVAHNLMIWDKQAGTHRAVQSQLQYEQRNLKIWLYWSDQANLEMWQPGSGRSTAQEAQALEDERPNSKS